MTQEMLQPDIWLSSHNAFSNFDRRFVTERKDVVEKTIEAEIAGPHP